MPRPTPARALGLLAVAVISASLATGGSDGNDGAVRPALARGAELGGGAGVRYGKLTPHGQVIARDLPPPEASPRAGKTRTLPARKLERGRAAAAGQPAPEPNALDWSLGVGTTGGEGQAAPALEPRAAPNAGTSFDGLDSADNPFGLSPPDPQIAVGPSHVVEFVNVTGRIFTKTGTPVDTFLLDDFFAVLPNASISTDPKIIYDSSSGRFFAVFIDYAIMADEGRLYVAVSQTSDPTGIWNLYYATFSGALYDYPGIGLTDDKFTASGNLFDDLSEPPDYLGEQTMVAQKSDLVAGVPAPDVSFLPVRPLRFTVRPAHHLSAGSDQYLTTWNVLAPDQITVLRITGTPEAGNVSEASVTNLTTLAQDDPPPSPTAGGGDCIVGDQNLGPPPCINSGDFRMLEAVWRSNSLWSAASARCGSPARSCLHLVEVETVGAPSVVQDIMFGASGSYFSWPAIRTDAAGNLYTVFTHTRDTMFAEARVAGRQAGDPPNTMSGSCRLRSGETVHNSGRWGDYLGAAVDPADPSRVWVVGQYAKNDGLLRWGTSIGAFDYNAAGCGITPGIDSDLDGCTNEREVGLNPAQGGARDPTDFWDFFDTPDPQAPAGPPSYQRDRVIELADIFRVASRFGTTGSPGGDPLADPPKSGYHTAYDRAPPGNPELIGPPDGAIDIGDVLAVAAQFGHTCA